MPNIKITVAGKIATNTTPGVVIVCGNSDYTVTFDLDAEWAAEAARTARFVYYRDGLSLYQDVAFTGNTVAVPALYGVAYVLVGVYAGDLRTTTPAKVLCDRSILCGDPLEVLTPEEKAKLQAQIGDLSKLSTTDKSSLVAAINEAAKTGGNSSQNADNGTQAVLNGWSGIAHYVLGDSISAEASIGVGHTTKLYHTFMREILSFGKTVNLARSGATLAENTASGSNNVLAQLASIGEDAGLITIYAGVNDRWNNTPIGAIGDTDTTTYYGAMESLCQALHTEHTGVPVLFITPTEQNAANCNAANTTGHTCRDFADAMISVAEKYSFDYYDANRKSGIYPQIAQNAAMFTSDKLHLSYNGHKRLADRLVAHLWGMGASEYYVPAEGITINPTTMVFTAISGYKTFDITLTPANTTEAITYASSDESVAIINGYGSVIPKGNGECDITVSCGAVSAVCHVVVNTSDGESGGEDSGDDTHTHSYSSTVTTAATCTTAGVKTYTCACGDSYTESIPATEHNYVDGTCTVCGAVDPDYEENVTDPVSEHVGKTWTFTAQKWSGEVYIAALLNGSEISNDDTLEASFILSGLNNCSIHTANTLRATNTTLTTVGNTSAAAGGACYMPTANTSEDSGVVTVSGSGVCYNRDGTNLMLTLRLATTALPASFKLESVAIKANGNDAPVLDFGAYMSADVYTLA